MSASAKMGFSVRAELTPFIDTNSAQAEYATATALVAITTWVDNSDADIVNHVADGNISASKANVPIGPFSDSEAERIMNTLIRVRKETGSQAWDEKKTYGGWIVTVLVALIAAIAAIWKWG